MQLVRSNEIKIYATFNTYHLNHCAVLQMVNFFVRILVLLHGNISSCSIFKNLNLGMHQSQNHEIEIYNSNASFIHLQIILASNMSIHKKIHMADEQLRYWPSFFIYYFLIHIQIISVRVMLR
jgi:hypothetical protein